MELSVTDVEKLTDVVGSTGASRRTIIRPKEATMSNAAIVSMSLVRVASALSSWRLLA